eukprot:TRINITY_DN17333_c1_g1_i1.p1 TRINITY_DN17333_c1_g1~~TRINITY_DN17333_c1_g1_i1.p1  ORF type:complete len:335 (-),score=52.52 TRINITY_DN17333_c1_g1_i1:96-1100(-)
MTTLQVQPSFCYSKTAGQKRKLRQRALVKVEASESQQEQQQQCGKHVVITGANSGIGLQTAKVLAEKGFSTTLACRDLQRAKVAKNIILEETPGADVDILELKLDNLQSVSDAAKYLMDSDKDIDVLINNAGVMGCPYMQTEDGFEYQLGVNHLGHFLFTQGLLPKLRNNSKKSRVVNVASAAHVFGKMDLDDLDYQKNKYDAWKAYGRSKLANIMFTYGLASRIKASDICTVNCLHPGVVSTELGRYMFPEDGVLSKILMSGVRRFFKTPEQGALTTIYLAASPEVENITSKYYKDCKADISSPQSYDAQAYDKLWEVSVEQTQCTKFLENVL